MTSLAGTEKEVLLYLKSSFDHNNLGGVKASEVAANIDQPLADVVAACEKLEQKSLVTIEKRHLEGGKARDLEVKINGLGLDFLMKEKRMPLP